MHAPSFALLRLMTQCQWVRVLISADRCCLRDAGIRIPNHGFVRDLCRGVGGALALTSANPSGAPSALEVTDFQQLWPSCSAVFDGAPSSLPPHRRPNPAAVRPHVHVRTASAALASG